MEAHAHDWKECSVIGAPGRYCEECGRFEQITKAHFKQSFGRAHWRFAKEHADRCVFGGYMKNKRQRPRSLRG